MAPVGTLQHPGSKPAESCPGDLAARGSNGNNGVMVAPAIRHAVIPADADALARVYVSSAAHHARLDPGFYRVPPVHAVAERYRSGPAGPRPDLLVAELDGRIIGMAVLAELAPPGPASMITAVRTASAEVAILDGHRGQGVGSLLMQAAEHAARTQGMRRLMLDAAHANDEALHFYRTRLGYQDQGVLLRKDLPSPPSTHDSAPTS
jgi:GNAT superfamily N-acetyltransferase